MSKRNRGTKQPGNAKRIRGEPGEDPNYDANVVWQPLTPKSEDGNPDAISYLFQADTVNAGGTVSWVPPSQDHQFREAVAFRPRSLPRPQPPQPRRLLPAAPDALPGRAVESQDSKTRGREAVEGLVVSPFTVNDDRLIASPGPRYPRPENGQVSGYVKFNWPSLGLQVASLTWTTSQPRMLPPQFGLQAKMNDIDMKLFDFYIKNWCPGRSVLRHTNFWLDMALMHGNEGILQAITCLGGIYIYDYVPNERLRQRINQLYVAADQNYTAYLNAPESWEVGKGQEVITMTVLLSMLDVVLIERRRKKPDEPRWLKGYKKGEYLLRVTDPRQRFREGVNIQSDNLRASLSIIVGQGVILTETMLALPAPNTMNPEKQSGRFRWLIYGSKEDMHEIHGGCGFSRILLHLISNVTYCAARLHQDPKSLIPTTTTYLLRTLKSLRQWSREGKDWELAQKYPLTIDSVRNEADDMIIDSSQTITEVTAEAWRIAAIIYLQCRLERLPRNHPDVVANLEDLAKCIRIIPTSGPHFTAQVPILPAFFLGLLATEPKLVAISENWFEQVASTPARSSIPPLYNALLRIRGWINKKVQIPRDPTNLSKDISQRYAWWEYLVTKILETEEEILCLT